MVDVTGSCTSVAYTLNYVTHGPRIDVKSDELSRARELAGFTQDDVAAALGVARPMISYWETGARQPNGRQRLALERLYGRPIGADVDADVVGDVGPNHAEMLYRRAPGGELAAASKHGLRGFVDFLEFYGELIRSTQVDHRPMRQSPFMVAPGFESPDDARRKAEEVRAHLRLGLGPIVDVDDLCDLLGITVFRAAMGSDLEATAISGAFYKHPDVGFSIVVNLEMTPGRRRFTLAHEIAHALLHSDHDAAVVSGAKKDPRERFADHFAAEFLMPTEGMRRALEEIGVRRKVTDPADAIHLQRFFNVSWVTTLVRLRQAKLVSVEHTQDWGRIRPVVFAQSLGYPVSQEELRQDPEAWGLHRYPRGFLRALRMALRQHLLSVETAADRTGVTVEEIANLAVDGATDSDALLAREVSEFRSILQ